MDEAERIAEVIGAETGGPVQVRKLERLPGGACQELFRVELDIGAGALRGARRVVLRSDARSRLSGTLTRREEFAVINAAVAAGVRTPPARWLSRGLLREDAWAYFLDWADGEALGGKVVRGPELAAARPRLIDELAAELARIHSIRPREGDGLGALRRPDQGGVVAGELETVERMLDALREPHPALELALGWLKEHQPPPQEITLVHGDFRTGNYLVTAAGLSALLDWEFSHFGSPLEDLAWLCLRDWRFGQLKLPAGGVGTRAALYEAYERHSGRRVDVRAAHYFEVLGNVRWAVGCVEQGERYLSGREADLELAAIGRRAAEMEWEALRLIEQGWKGWQGLQAPPAETQGG